MTVPLLCVAAWRGVWNGDAARRVNNRAMALRHAVVERWGTPRHGHRVCTGKWEMYQLRRGART